MSSRKQEERNEKVIRGLMKLPPNRKCINCNNLGPQYVCTNFWTFVCMTCSGIHREFTHRVKSVSMSKFTSEEVEALQNGGNQRARETYLKDWDPQRERLPNNSNPEKVRQFIKDVYVDRKYAGQNNSDKPPKDKQNLRNHEDDTRRASSYHSYSQSPPYDYQYEERRYGKQAALSRKPGSDRGIYERNAYGFLSPSRLSDHVSEKSRVSDYSVSTGGDPFRSGPQSPTFQRDVGYSSPSSTEISRDISILDVQQQKVNTFAETKAPPLQRSASVDNSISSNSANSASNAKSLTSSVSDNFDGLDLFSAPFVSQTATSTSAAIDLFQLPHELSNSSIDFFQPSNPNLNLPSQNSLPPSLSLFSDPPSEEGNQGWATFDKPQISEPSRATFDNTTPTTIPSTIGDSQEKTDQFIFPNFNGSSSLSKPNQWDADLQNVDTLFNAINPQHSWNAFEDSSVQQNHLQSFNQQSISQVTAQNPSSIADQYHGFGVLEAGVRSHVPDRKSTNPFDLPYDSDMESGNMFLELSSLQTALPNGLTPTSLVGGVTQQPWFPQDPVAPFGPQGALGFMGPQAPSPQIQNVPTQAPVASSIGGNPFA